MIDPPLLLAFLVAATVLTVTPGTDTAIVLRAATVEGRRPAILAGSGILLGCAIWGLAVSLGLGALLRASELAYVAVKLAGAAYLVWIGATLLLRPRATLEMPDADRRTGRTAFWRGFLTNMLNPKIGVFYITFLPQFVPRGAGVAGYSVFLALIHVALTVVWFAALIAAAVPLGRLLRRPAAIRTMDRLTGAIFVGFGVRLAVSRG